MRAAGIEGARRTRRVRTTRPDPATARHPDLVERAFRAEAPNHLWVTDLERHEALTNRVEVGDLRRRVVVAAR